MGRTVSFLTSDENLYEEVISYYRGNIPLCQRSVNISTSGEKFYHILHVDYGLLMNAIGDDNSDFDIFEFADGHMYRAFSRRGDEIALTA